jgi:hypothetical protein
MPDTEDVLAGIGGEIEKGMPPEVLADQHDLGGNRARNPSESVSPCPDWRLLAKRLSCGHNEGNMVRIAE